MLAKKKRSGFYADWIDDLFSRDVPEEVVAKPVDFLGTRPLILLGKDAKFGAHQYICVTAG